jgi:hypothetical protein
MANELNELPAKLKLASVIATMAIDECVITGETVKRRAGTAGVKCDVSVDSLVSEMLHDRWLEPIHYRYRANESWYRVTGRLFRAVAAGTNFALPDWAAPFRRVVLEVELAHRSGVTVETLAEAAGLEDAFAKQVLMVLALARAITLDNGWGRTRAHVTVQGYLSLYPEGGGPIDELKESMKAV